MRKREMRPEKKKKSFAARCAIFFAALILLSAVAVGGVFAYAAYYAGHELDLAGDEELFAAAKEGGRTIYYYDGAERPSGELTGYVPVEILEEGVGEEKRWTPLSQIAPAVREGFVAVEDRKFYEHRGFDPIRTVYALANTVFHFRGNFGASTITQQVVKNVSGDSEPTFRRKWNEILRAIELERRHQKDEILEVYLNILPMSENTIGIGAAAKTYFGKEAADLSLSESATLIGIANAPTRYNPYLHPDACLEKRATVLSAMLDFGCIGEEEYEDAVSAPLGVVERSEKEKTVRDWFIETAEADVARDLARQKGISEEAARSLLAVGGYHVYTTENAAMQSVLTAYFEDLSHFPAAVTDGLQYAMCVCDPKTGDLLCTVGRAGKKEGDRWLNFAEAPVTPGSVLKPIALYAPLINEKRINPATVLDDVPLDFSSGRAYPNNSPAVYDGLITIADALKKSKNTVAVRLYRMRGAEAIFRDLDERFGFDTLVRKDGNFSDLDVSPLALGQLTYGVSLRKLTGAYCVFPAEGRLAKSRSYLAVYDGRGRLVLDHPKSEERIYRPEAARIMNQLLSGVVREGTAKSVRLKEKYAVAGKTGTSGQDRDRLFIGYTPSMVGGIWCGYEDGTRAVGNHAPSHLRIWDEVMEELTEIAGSRREEFSVEGLVKETFCRDSGERYSPVCTLDARGSRLSSGWFEPDNRPTGLCSRHIVCYYDTATEAVAGEGCPKEDLKRIALIDVPDRTFPEEIAITDAQYVYRKLPDHAELPDDYDEAYFARTLPPGEYAGKSKGKKQFNSFCYLHEGA